MMVETNSMKQQLDIIEKETVNCTFTTDLVTSSQIERTNEVEIISALEHQINVNGEETAFYIANLQALESQYKKWRGNLPQFQPFYAVKCNNDVNVLSTLASLGTNFDCASMEEIRSVLALGVSVDRIIYANPCKEVSNIKYAYEKGVERMTFDNADELVKVKANHPTAKLVIRIHVDDSKSICQLGAKFGVRLGKTKALLEQAMKLNLDVIGVSFHVGSGCLDAKAYEDAIKRARGVFEEAKEIGYNFTLLDIGGGFPGFSQNGAGVEFEEVAQVINEAMSIYFSDISDKLELIAEPGRFFAASAFTLTTNITSRRAIDDNEKSFMYYINDGVYGSFNCLIFDHAQLAYPQFMVKSPSTNLTTHTDKTDQPTYNSSVWGPTCDSMDCLTKSISLPELSVGDWLVFENMGAYTLVAASRFNGMNKAKVFYLNNTRVI